MCEYRDIQARSYNHCCSENAISITHSECVFVVLGNQREKRMRRFILLYVASPTVLHFHTLSNKRRDFRKKKKITEHKMCFCILFTTFVSEIFLILRRNERDMIKNVYLSSCKVPVILVIF
jgi:hypothetical protein